MRLVFFTSSTLCLQGCFFGIDATPTAITQLPPMSQRLMDAGAAEVCAYTSGLGDLGYASARVTYPCDLAPSAPATTLTGGFTNTKEQMTWLSEHLSSHGFIVMTMTPTHRFSEPAVWAKAHIAGFHKLAAENTRSDSPLRGKVDLSKRAIMGFSMGGGGALLAAETLAGANTATVALAPYLSSASPLQSVFDAQQVPTLILGSELDELVKDAATHYSRLPNIEKGLAIFAEAGHFDWYGRRHLDTKKKFRTLVTAFLEVQLKGNTAADSYLDAHGAEHLEHLDAGWFSQYAPPNQPRR